MHLTRFPMNPARRDTRRLVGNPHALHAAVMSAFSPDVLAAPRQEGRVLWRLDQRGPALTLYVVSPFEPDLTHLVEQAGWPATEGWSTRRYTPLLERLQTGQRWHFRLTANPVRRVAVKDGGRSKAMAHVTASQQEEWLGSRVEQHGFRFAVTEQGAPLLTVQDRRTVSFPRDGARVTLAYATFEGVLEVADPAALRAALVGGIGRAKGYGCGLLTLARAGDAPD